MARRGLLILIAVLLVAGLAGAIAVEDDAADVALDRPTTSSVAVSTTSTAPTTSTSAAPPPATPAIDSATRVVVTASGVVVPVVSVNSDGTVTVRTPCENTAVVRGARAVGPVTVVLDPGHGGGEPGAVGANGLSENALNLAVTGHVERTLAAAGVTFVSTRTGNYRVTLTSRAAIVAAAKPRVFVSIHHNGDPDGPRSGPGTETFYQHRSQDARRLGGLIYEEVVRALGQYQVPWQADTDAGVKTRLNTRGGDYYAMLRQTAGTPSVLAELAFLSNPPEAELLARPDVQKVEGEAVARGIIRFLTTRDPGSGFTDAYPRTVPAGGGGGKSNCVDPPLG